MTGFMSKRAMAADRMMDIDGINAELAEIAEQEREEAIAVEFAELLEEITLRRQFDYYLEFYGYDGVG